MKRTAFVPTVDGRLEDRVVLTAHAAATALPPVHFGGGRLDYTIPYILGSNVPNQNNLNFSSNTFAAVVRVATRDFGQFHRTGNITALANRLGSLAHKFPLGQKNLTPIIEAELSRGSADGNLQGRVLNDMLTYLQDGIGQKFNVVKSHQPHATDVLLTYNAKS